MIIFSILLIIFGIMMIIRRQSIKKVQENIQSSQTKSDTSLPTTQPYKYLLHSDTSTRPQDSVINLSIVATKESEKVSSSIIAAKEPEKKETVFQKLEKLNVGIISFTIKENPTVKKIINAMRREGYLDSDYEGISNKEIKEDGIYGLEYYEFSWELIPNTLIYRDIANDHCFFVKSGLDANDLVTIGRIPQEYSEEFTELMNNPFSIENIINGGKYKTLDMDDYGNDKVFIRHSAYELNITIKFYQHSAKELALPDNYLIKSVPYEKVNNINKNTMSANPSKHQKLEYIKARKLTESFTVIDFETTGFSATDSEIIQIGAVKYSNGEIIDNFSSYVKATSSSISPTITRITGITEDMLSDAPTIEKILPSFLNYIKGQTLVAHNASFDMKFLLSAIDKCDINIENFRVIDTLTLSRRLIDGMSNYKLETLKKQLNLGDRKSHDALDDCYTTGSLYMTCFQKAQSN